MPTKDGCIIIKCIVLSLTKTELRPWIWNLKRLSVCYMYFQILFLFLYS